MKELTYIEYREDCGESTQVYRGRRLTHQEICQTISSGPIRKEVPEGCVFIGDEFYNVTDVVVQRDQAMFRKDLYRRSLPTKSTYLFKPDGIVHISLALLTDIEFQKLLATQEGAKQP